MRIWTKTRRHRITQSHMRRRLDLFLKSPLKTSRSTWTWSDSCGTRSGVHWSVCELIIKVWHSSALMSLFLWELESSRDASDNNHEKHISCHCVTPDPHSYSFFYSVCLVNYVRYYCVSSMSQRRRLSVNNNLNNMCWKMTHDSYELLLCTYFEFDRNCLPNQIYLYSAFHHMHCFKDLQKVVL